MSDGVPWNVFIDRLLDLGKTPEEIETAFRAGVDEGRFSADECAVRIAQLHRQVALRKARQN